MIDCIPSKAVKKYMEEKGFEHTDSEKATLIYNSGESIEVIIESLIELRGMTDDSELKKQITERVDIFEKTYVAFRTGGEGIVYRLKIKEYGDEEDIFYEEGYYSSFEAAVKFTKVFPGCEFYIQKNRLRDGSEDNSALKESDDYHYGSVEFDGRGKVKCFNTEEWNLALDLTLKSERFEGQTFVLCHPFKQSDIVRKISDGKRGIAYDWTPEERGLSEKLSGIRRGAG